MTEPIVVEWTPPEAHRASGSPATLRLGSGASATFGREPSCDIWFEDRAVSRRAGRITPLLDFWTLSNLSSHSTLVVENPEGGGEFIKVAPGRLDVPVPFELSRILLPTLGSGAASILVFAPGHRYGEPDQDDRLTTEPAYALDVTAKYFLVLVALCEPRLLEPGSSVIPTVQEIIERVGGNLTRAAVNFHIDYLARHKLHVRGDEGGGKADWQREALVATALRFNLVTPEHLALLPRRERSGPVRVLVVDDNPVVRSGLVSLLHAGGFEVVGETGDIEQALALTELHHSDVALLDTRLPGAQLLSRRTRVLSLSDAPEPDARGDAAGHLVHGDFTADELSQEIHRIAARGEAPAPSTTSVATAPPQGFGLSAREDEVMELIAQGRSNREIAAELFLTEKTVKNHLNRIYAKLNATSRAAAIAQWLGTSPDSVHD